MEVIQLIIGLALIISGVWVISRREIAIRPRYILENYYILAVTKFLSREGADKPFIIKGTAKILIGLFIIFGGVAFSYVAITLMSFNII